VCSGSLSLHSFGGPKKMDFAYGKYDLAILSLLMLLNLQK